MFELTIEFDDGELTLEIGDFDTLWELKEMWEGEGYDVDWEYEPA